MNRIQTPRNGPCRVQNKCLKTKSKSIELVVIAVMTSQEPLIDEPKPEREPRAINDYPYLTRMPWGFRKACVRLFRVLLALAIISFIVATVFIFTNVPEAWQSGLQVTVLVIMCLATCLPVIVELCCKLYLKDKEPTPLPMEQTVYESQIEIK